MAKAFFLTVFVGTLLLSSALWAAQEVQDAYTGTNVRREVTETGSLFNVLRGIYRPDYNKPARSATQTPYQRIAPPKWRYYRPKTEEETGPQTKKRAIDGRYYKPPAKPEKKKQ